MDVFASEERAQATFRKYFKAKSGNAWPLDEPFKPVKGKYVLVGTWKRLAIRCELRS